MCTLHQFLRFAGVGVVGTAAHYLCLYTLVEYAALDPVLGSSIGFVIGAYINYRLNRTLTFKSAVPFWSGFLAFLGVALFGALLNLAAMWTLIAFTELHYLIAQAVATCLVLLWNFLGNKFWTFNDARVES